MCTVVSSFREEVNNHVHQSVQYENTIQIRFRYERHFYSGLCFNSPCTLFVTSLCRKCNRFDLLKLFSEHFWHPEKILILLLGVLFGFLCLLALFRNIFDVFTPVSSLRCLFCGQMLKISGSYKIFNLPLFLSIHNIYDTVTLKMRFFFSFLCQMKF